MKCSYLHAMLHLYLIQVKVIFLVLEHIIIFGKTGFEPIPEGYEPFVLPITLHPNFKK